METQRQEAERIVARERLDELMGRVFGGEIHAQRLASLSDGVDGVLHAANLGIRAIGHGLAVANGLAPRHAIKQVDRLLSNRTLLREDIARCWVRCVVTERQELLVHVDWTEREDSDQSMIVLGTHTTHGRSTPLVWKTVRRSARKDQRNAHEDERLCLLADVLPAGGHVTVLADPGVSDTKLYRFLKEELGFDDIIRFRGVVYVESADGARRQAKDWLGMGGRMRMLRGARVTAGGEPVPVVGCVQQKPMHEPWLLASSRDDLKGATIKNLYGTRCTVEMCQTQPVKMTWCPLRCAPWTIGNLRGSLKREHVGNIHVLPGDDDFPNQALHDGLACFKGEPVQIGSQQAPKGFGVINDLLPISRPLLRTRSWLTFLLDLL